MTQVDAATWQTLEAADYLKQGILPADGGYLSQTKWFATAARYAKGVEDTIRAELKLI